MKEIDASEAKVMWKRAGAGFVGQAGWVALVQQDDDPMPCFRTHDSDHPQDCVERWATVFGLPARPESRPSRPSDAPNTSAPRTTCPTAT